MADELTKQQVQELHTLWKEFPDTTAARFGRVKRAVHRVIIGNATPVRIAPYRMPQIWEELFHAELKQLEEAKLISPSASSWDAPMFTVSKKIPGQIPLVSQTKQRYRPRSVLLASRGRDITHDGPAKYFRVFDMAREFYQVPIAHKY